MQYYLAVDIGASSGRHILGHVEDGKMQLEEIYRFPNSYQKKDGASCWDLETLFREIVKGMQACKGAGKVPVSMGIDTWAVDYVLLDTSGAVLGNTVAYRDARTQGMDSLLEEILPFTDLYEKTGIQKQIFNTIYQLTALKQTQPDQLKQADRFLMVPEYFNYRLTGKAENEYTNATSTALVNARDKEWDTQLLKICGFPQKIFGPLRMPGTVLGTLLPEIQAQVGFDCRVLLPATHDTGSAFLAVPARDENAVYISSGTWSLLGVENRVPITTAESMKANFTNEGGYEYRYRYLKNIMGLWMIQSIRHNYDDAFSFAQLEQMARETEFAGRVDVNHSRFLAPDSMVEAVQAACAETGQPVPQTPGEVMRCVYESLSNSYRDAIWQLQHLTGKLYTSINIVGGGSRDNFLNFLTAQKTALPVYAGPTEGTALGNLMAQMIAAGEYEDLTAARSAIHKSFEIKEIKE